MTAVSIRLNTRFRRLVAGWRKTRMRLWVLSAGESERSSSEVGLASLDFRLARRPEFEQMAQRLGVGVGASATRPSGCPTRRRARLRALPGRTPLPPLARA